jgi:hypothetical protein
LVLIRRCIRSSIIASLLLNKADGLSEALPGRLRS